MEKKMAHHLSLSNASELLSLLISELTLFCYFILSHPLYLSYFIFFYPYLVKIISYLSPLFITTSILLLALLNNIISPASLLSSPDSDNVSTILLSFKNALLLEAHAEIDKLDCFEDFEVYKIVFQENPIEFFDYTSPEESEKSLLDSSVQEKDPATAKVDLENSGVSVDEFESKNWTDNVERKKIEALGTKVEKVVEKQEKEEEEMMMGNEVDKVKKAHSWSNLDQNLGSYGSMRKEKEWTRTLACKLYEERHNASSDEGMDLLWETYELDSGKSKLKRDNTTKKKKKKGESKSKSKSYKKYEEDEGEEEEDMNEQLCCLQALKFSSGKINLGMGKPNLVKISKAIKGFGWLHHVTKKNKVHCGDRF